MSIAISMPHTENGITVDLPGDYFQFENCPGYIAIKSASVKEIDFGWYNASSDTLHLIELKNFHHPANPLFLDKSLSKPGIVQEIINELLDKSIHSVCMIETDRSGTKSCVPVRYGNASTLNVVHVINTMPGQESYLAQINDIVNARFKAFKAIFRINSLIVMSYAQAKKLFGNLIK